MNKIPPENIFKSYDIRGVYPDQLDEENVVSITKAIYVFFKKNHPQERRLKVVLSRDMRVSSPALHKAISQTLVNLGAEVTDIGIASTPTFYFAVFYYAYDAGMQITASHNPKDYNGIKIVTSGPNGLVKIGKPTGMEEIKRLAIDGVEPQDMPSGSIELKNGVLEDEITNALSIAGDPQIKPLKIVADAANAVGALYLEELFKKIPGELIKMNFELDGTFPAHPADPLDYRNLENLRKRVIEEGADVGFAPDGDGDRFFFVDEMGEVIQPSFITALVAKELLRKHPGQKILFDIRYILTPQKIVEENGGESVITRVGHAFISQDMDREGGIFAGESSAHYFFRATGNAESQVPVILAVLEVMTREGKKLSEIIEELRRSYESGEINFEVDNAKEVMEKLKQRYSDGQLNELDGIAISYPEWRFSVRSSNTEPLIRLNVEGQSKELVEQRKHELIALIK